MALGNSHTMFFSQAHPSEVHASNQYFESFRLGACTAYTFKKHMPTIGSMKLVGPIMLCLGEIDIRAHIFRQTKIQNRHPCDLLYEVIDIYWDCVMELNKTNGSIVWIPHATSNIENKRPESPVVGPVEERNKLSLLWEREIEKRCQIENIPCVSILRHLIDENLKTKTEYYSDYCHLGTKAYPLMIEEFKKKGLIV